MSTRDHLNPDDLISVRADLWVRSRPTITARAHGDAAGGWLSVDIDTEARSGLHLSLSDPDAADDLAAALTWAAGRARDLAAIADPDATDRRVFTPTGTAHETGQAA